MSRLTRPLSVVLLGLLLLAWGPCPGLWAQALGAVAGPERGAERPACCCGCEQAKAQPTPDPADDRPLDEDCPFCSVFGGRSAALSVAAVEAADTPELLAIAWRQPDHVESKASTCWEGPDDHTGPPPRGGPLGPVVLLI